MHVLRDGVRVVLVLLLLFRDFAAIGVLQEALLPPFG